MAHDILPVYLPSSTVSDSLDCAAGPLILSSFGSDTEPPAKICVQPVARGPASSPPDSPVYADEGDSDVLACLVDLTARRLRAAQQDRLDEPDPDLPSPPGLRPDTVTVPDTSDTGEKPPHLA